VTGNKINPEKPRMCDWSRQSDLVEQTGRKPESSVVPQITDQDDRAMTVNCGLGERMPHQSVADPRTPESRRDRQRSEQQAFRTLPINDRPQPDSSNEGAGII